MKPKIQLRLPRLDIIYSYLYIAVEGGNGKGQEDTLETRIIFNRYLEILSTHAELKWDPFERQKLCCLAAVVSTSLLQLMGLHYKNAKIILQNKETKFSISKWSTRRYIQS